MTPEEIAKAVSEYASDSKALDIVTLDLREFISYTDYFVIATGRTDRQVKAIHDRVAEGMKRDHAQLPVRVDGVTQSQWILLDYGDVVMHVFTPETREYYRLEQLWGEAPAAELTAAL
ncbi:MAG: ribosome silencing factor [Solirubrobacterales bacterium]|nr:ribosome silencing factor [Solirubrobacterales bacterium]